MRRIMLAGLVVTLAAALPHSASAQRTAADPERAAVAQVINGYAENVQSGNFAAIGALFTPGAHVITGTEAIHGFADYQTQLQAELGRYTGARYTHTGIETVVRGNVAWSNFRWQMSGGGTTPAPVLGRGTMVLEKVSDRWMIAHVHFSR